MTAGQTDANELRPDLDETSAEFLASIPRDFAREHLLLSVGRPNGSERLAVSDRTNPAAVHNVGVRLGVPVTTIVTDDETIARAIDAAYGKSDREEQTPGASNGDDGGVNIDDFDYAPFVEKGGLGKARQVFGNELSGLLAELNEALAA